MNMVEWKVPYIVVLLKINKNIGKSIIKNSFIPMLSKNKHEDCTRTQKNEV
jgi:hypothetical protein